MHTLIALRRNSTTGRFRTGRKHTMQPRDSILLSAQEIVMEYLQALIERRDFKSARSYLKDNVTYVSPLNSFDGVEPYLKYNESLLLPKPDIKKIFTDGNDVCLLYEMTLTTTPPVTFPVSFWAHVDGEKISSIKLVFDPRPFIRPGR